MDRWSSRGEGAGARPAARGAARGAARRWRLAATYMFFFYLGRDVRTSRTWPPTNAKGRGIAHLPGLEAEMVF